MKKTKIIYLLLFVLSAFAIAIINQVNWWITLCLLTLPIVLYVLVVLYQLVKLIIEINEDEKRWPRI